MMKKGFIFTIIWLTTFYGTNANTEYKQAIFEYSKLTQNKQRIVKEFHDKGYIAVKNVPGFAKAYREMIEEGQNFIFLSEEEKNKVKPDNSYINGWSFGEEKFNGMQDFYKGSYYASVPDSNANVWPNNNFKKKYLTLGNIMFSAAKEILTLLDFDVKKHRVNSGVGRMLYYAPVNVNENDKNPYWCGLHQGHGLFSALAPGIFLKNNKRVSKPSGSGLHVRGKPINVPSDVLLFQVGETFELITNGKVTATEHHVQKAFGGYERFAFAFFVDVDKDMVINSTITKYNDRYRPGMTYKEWSQAAFDKYYGK